MKIYIILLPENLRKVQLFYTFIYAYLWGTKGLLKILNSTIIINEDMNVIVPLQIWMIVI